ncbi:M14 family zinc carboxypeptidase [Agrobacterium tumefaciens]|uniref:M14 family zinc carboxypeptidase n=1 Tax=Agrobacterium tumefaciens TaxID=358 RepID=UPI00287D6553|nr:M14 family zinc carboxypeptidase [Agrobacterium tumefaciens]MDS7595616.1 M14 family zinc carboxypeptidase [Agrobacterium tumefaciens]
MTVIFEKNFVRTLTRLVERVQPGKRLQLWTFDDRKNRQQAEERLAKQGVTARIRSAYKPLLHAFIEEIDLTGVERLQILYPVHAAAPQNRFLLEAYPLAAMIGDRKIDFIARGDGELHYDVVLETVDGKKSLRVFAPNHLHVDAVGETNLSPTGWLIEDDEGPGNRLETEFELLFGQAMAAIARHDWGEQEPYFDELNIGIRLPVEDKDLPVGDEVLSLREALHEDFYFSLLEFFQKKSGRPSGDRGLQPGQIVPEIVASNDEVSVRIETRPLSALSFDGVPQQLDDAEAPLGFSDVAASIDAIGAVTFDTDTRSGRVVKACYVKGTDFPVMISAGQHANETTGVAGALRAANRLVRREGAHFTLSPMENPDGYALHQRLRRDNPRHMHHAARYTAFGDDLEYRIAADGAMPSHETAIRHKARQLSGAHLHLNLHGYPAHEWTRPFSGYVPRNFGAWTLPKGFFLIARHHAGWANETEKLLDAVTRHLMTVPGLMENNVRQIALYEAHAGRTGFRFINGFPCFVSEDQRGIVPITLITEYPDETVYGVAFRAGHAAQMETVLAAYDAWQEIAANIEVA